MKKLNKLLLTLIIIMTLFVVLPINSKAINIMSVDKVVSVSGMQRDSNNANTIKYYYYVFGNFNSNEHSVTYSLKNLTNYRMRVTFVSAGIEDNARNDENFNKDLCMSNLYGHSIKNAADLKGPCKERNGKGNNGRFIAIGYNSPAIHMIGLKSVELKIEILFNNGSSWVVLNKNQIESRLGDLNIRFVDVDNQQAIRIDSSYTDVEKSTNIMKGKRYLKPYLEENLTSKNTSQHRFQSEIYKDCTSDTSCPTKNTLNDSCSTDTCGVVTIKEITPSNNGEIKLTYFTGQHNWSSGGSYKYGHAFFKVRMDDDIDSKTPVLKIEKHSYNFDQTDEFLPGEQGTGWKLHFNFLVEKYDLEGNLLKSGEFWTKKDTGTRDINLTKDWKCAPGTCKYKVTEIVKDGWINISATGEQIYNGSDLTFTFKNVQQPTSKEACDLELKTIKSKYGNISPGVLTSDKSRALAVELLTLYRKYRARIFYEEGYTPDKLLNFDARNLNSIDECGEQPTSLNNNFSCDENGLGFKLARTGYQENAYHTFFAGKPSIEYDSPYQNPIYYTVGTSEPAGAGGDDMKNTITAFCRYTITGESTTNVEGNKIIYDGTTVKKGQLAWKTDAIDTTVFKLDINVRCVTYFSFPTATPEGDLKLYTLYPDLQIQLMNTYNNSDWYKNAIDVSVAENTEHGEKTLKPSGATSPTYTSRFDLGNPINNIYYVHGYWDWKYTVNYSYGSDFSYCLKKGTGSAKNEVSCSADRIGPVFGFPTDLDAERNDFEEEFIISFKNESLKNYFSTVKNDFEDSTKCSYIAQNELISPPPSKKLNLEFRIIDTENPFPGINGTGRTTGSNWKDKESEITSAKANNSYNKSKKDPLISIRLTPTNIEAISSKYNGYNKDHSYDDFELDCTEGKECTSSFVTRLLNGEFGAVEGSCEKVSNRKYCVGES